jgi:hypothetical protein
VKKKNLIADLVCPFCDLELTGQGAIDIAHTSGFVRVSCPSCGTYLVSGSAIDVLPQWEETGARRAAIAFAITRMTEGAEPPRLTTSILQDLRKNASLPIPEKMIDEFILWLGRRSTHVGFAVDVTYPKSKAILGVENLPAFNYLTDWIDASGYFNCVHQANLGGPQPLTNCRLTPAGWERYTELSRSREASKRVFMAMKFGDDILDSIVRDHFAPAVAATGFKLHRLNEGQPAGLIDDQLRVAIRTARILVCDLSHGNQGAYWEGGYAEGLEIPVIYTCRKDVFDDRNHESHPHFDTNHMLTVLWDAATPEIAAQRLKDTIRATLPWEASLTD